MLENIAKKINKQGFSAHTTVISAGLYYDGVQHGELIPCVFVSVEHNKTGHNKAPIEKAIKTAISNNPSLTFRTVYHPYMYIYEIAEKANFEHANKLQAEANCFLVGFWEEIHNNPKARENNAEDAIKAGQARLAQYGYVEAVCNA